ncbi:hypothetical protein SO802_028999 [Lithocarpus litseifolius]|uniref:Reverse transcriptase zinc-binding domain-containing protein n=1 Tax=Lithocarpus litseifolius TaxID=425828 RepID=A0AAW2BRS2_9ROSI
MQSTHEDVLNLRLGDLQTQDRIYWKENKAHRFTVRSTYLVALRLNQRGVVEHSRAHEDKRVWNKLWRLRVPPKAEESVCHSLWECPFPTNVWALVRGKMQKSSAVVQKFHSLARLMEDRLTGKEMEVWAVVAWSIWNARNRFCFEEKQSQPGDILTVPSPYYKTTNV